MPSEIKESLTNVRGPAARIVEFTARSVAADQPAAARMTGPDQGRRIEVDVPRGFPTPESVPTEQYIATVFAAPDSLPRKRTDSIYAAATNAAAYGVQMNPAAAQNAGLSAALAAAPAGALLTVPGGSMGVNSDWIEVPRDVTIDLSNVTLVNLAAFGGLRFRAPAMPVFTVNTMTTVTIPADTANEISVAAPGVRVTLSDPVDWEPGDLVKLVAADELTDQRVTSDPADTRRSRYGQTMVVHSVAGNVVTFLGVLREFARYTTNIRAAKRPDVRLTIINPTWRLDSGAPDNERLGIQLEGFTLPVIENPRIPRVNAGAITIRGCFGATITNPKIGYARDYPGTSDFGYGIYDEASEYTTVFGGVISHCRHAYTDGTPRGVVYTDVDYYGRTFGAKVIGSHAYAIAATAWDTHLDGEGASFIDVSADSCGQGSHFRGRNHKLLNARFTDITGNAISIADEAVQAGTSYGHVVDGVSIDGCATAIAVSGRPSDHPLTGQVLKTKSSISNVRATRVTSRLLYTANVPVTLNNIDATMISSMDGTVAAQGDLSILLASNIRIKYEGFAMSGRFFRAINANTTMHIDGFTVEWDTTPTGTVFGAQAAASGQNVTLLNGLLWGYLEYESSQARVSYTVLNNDARPGKVIASDANITLAAIRRAVADMQAPTVVLNFHNTGAATIVIPQLPNGTADGQQMVILCRAGSTSTLTQRHGATGNADLVAAANKVLSAGQRMRLVWSGDIWLEV